MAVSRIRDKTPPAIPLLLAAALLAAFTASPVRGQQPAGALNVVTEGGAAGDGTTDDTASINSAVILAESQGLDVYFPPGDYLVSGRINAKDGVSLYGDRAGLSVIKAQGAFHQVGDDEWGRSIDHVAIEDLHFVNVGVLFGGGYYKSFYAVRRCLFVAHDPAVGTTDFQLNWQYIQDGVVEDSLFLRQADGHGVPVSTFKTRRCTFSNNVWGVDLDRAGWLTTEWPGFASWTDLPGKLQALRATFNLDWDQGQLQSCFYGSQDTDLKVYDNIMNGSPFDDATSSIQDHVMYMKSFADLEIVGNWMRGWPMNPSGGLKLRNAPGPATVAANHFIDTPVLQYTYTSGDPLTYQHVLHYRNHHGFTPGLGESFDRRGYSYWEDGAIGGDLGIEYHQNVFDCPPGTPNVNINITNRGDPAQHTVYASNLHLGTTNLVPFVSAAGPEAYTAGAPDPARTAPYAAHPVPMPDIPPYGGVDATPALVPGTLRLSFPADAGAAYVLEHSESGGSSWTPTGMRVVGDGATQSLFDVGGSTASRLYGVRRVGP